MTALAKPRAVERREKIFARRRGSTERVLRGTSRRRRGNGMITWFDISTSRSVGEPTG